MEAEDLVLFERSIGDAIGRASRADLDAELDERGWHDALADDPRAAISVLFERQGAAGATSSALAHVVAHALGGAAGPRAMAVLPAVGGCSPPGALVAGRLRLRGLAPAGLVDRSSALVVAAGGDQVVVAEVPTAMLGLREIGGADPDLGLLEVTGDVELAGAGSEVSAVTWAVAVALGRLAIAHELVGASRTMLELACDHARHRIQFDRPVASFQAVRHRLAETSVAIAMAEAMLDAAWLDGTPVTSAMAKAVAGRQAKTAARHCQQVLAGIGFTVEHPFHRFVRRTLVLDALLGSAASLTASLGAELIDHRELPPLLPL